MEDAAVLVQVLLAAEHEVDRELRTGVAIEDHRTQRAHFRASEDLLCCRGMIVKGMKAPALLVAQLHLCSRVEAHELTMRQTARVGTLETELLDGQSPNRLVGRPQVLDVLLHLVNPFHWNVIIENQIPVVDPVLQEFGLLIGTSRSGVVVSARPSHRGGRTMAGARIPEATV